MAPDWNMGGFPKYRGTFSGVPIIRIIVFWVPSFREATIL